MANKPSQPLEICDIGGGAGVLLGSATTEYRSQWGAHKDFGRSLKTTMTTLLHHNDQRVIEEEYPNAIDDVRTMVIELPPDDFYNRFDIITAQNSVYYCSQHPELATLNIWKMLKDGGVALVTIPQGVREIERIIGSKIYNYFNVEKYLQSCGLFMYQEIGKNEDGSISVLLKKT